MTIEEPREISELMHNQQSHVHHYVPQWYQRRFLEKGKCTYFYLDLHPETVVHGGVKHQKRALFFRGPKTCFYRDDLYTLKLGELTTDEIEKRFFGAIDNHGRRAVELFSDYQTFAKVAPQYFRFLTEYMGAQRFRTPKGLDFLENKIGLQDHNVVLAVMGRNFEIHETMWMEGIWEIARARLSPTKFIVSDNPVTFFNSGTFPHLYPYPDDAGLEEIGTRTLFPLGLDSCLIITHIQLVRNPHANPSKPRVNARAFGQTMKYTLDTQFGRELEEDEVRRINFILKKRATSYIAAAEEEWLYPERQASTRKWSMLDDDWFLLPHMYKVSFSRGVIAGRNDGPTWVMDEYGRSRTDPHYQDEGQHRSEWITFNQAKKEWAKKRRGRSVAHVETAMGKKDEVSDRIMQQDLDGTS
jgi:Protein of unknown function (DUF4238)